MAAAGALVGAVGGAVVTMMAVAAWVWWPSPGRPWLGTRAQAIALGTDTGNGAIARHLNAVIEAHERFHTPCGNPSYLASGTIRSIWASPSDAGISYPGHVRLPGRLQRVHPDTADPHLMEWTRPCRCLGAHDCCCAQAHVGVWITRQPHSDGRVAKDRSPSLLASECVDQVEPTIEHTIAMAARLNMGARYPSPEAEPYVFHGLHVMLQFADPVDQMAAVLHDVIEDTEITLDTLRRHRVSTRSCRRDRRSDAPLPRLLRAVHRKRRS